MHARGLMLPRQAPIGGRRYERTHGSALHRHHDSVLRSGRGLRRRLRSAERGRLMTVDHIVGLIVTLGLLVYLTYALLKPEKF